MTSIFCSQWCGTLTSNSRDPLNAGRKLVVVISSEILRNHFSMPKYSLIMNDCNIAKESSARKVFHAAINHDRLGVTGHINLMMTWWTTSPLGTSSTNWGEKWPSVCARGFQHNHVHRPNWTSLAVQGGVTPDLKKVQTFYDDKPTNDREVSSAWPLILGM